MSNLWLYVVTVLIWGTTWFAIRFQLGVVAVEVSVFYRYVLATTILLLVCLLRKQTLNYSLYSHLFMAMQGIFLFCINYILFYYASYDLATGLVSVMFSTVVLMNVLNGRLFANQVIKPMVVVGGILGLLGLTLIFIPELQTMERSANVKFSIFLCVLATLSASIGNVLTLKNKANGVSVVPATTWGMFYGTIATLIYLLFKGVPFNFDYSLSYVSSLSYLAVFGSVIAFLCYLTLIENIGADKASYTSVMFPAVALVMSTLFEDYQWTLLALMGMALVMCGNFLVLKTE